MENVYSDGTFIFVNSPFAEAYIPTSLFERNEEDISKSSIAYAVGDGIATIGIMYMRFFKSEDQDRETVPTSTLGYPNMITTKPSNIINNVNLTFNDVTDSYKVLQYEKGDVLMEATSKQSYQNVERFMKLIGAGAIPRSLSYEDIYHMWIKNFEINGFNPGVSNDALQAIVALFCRCPEEITKPFRFAAAKGGVSHNDYLPVNMNTLSASSSVLSSIAFERFSEKLTSSINMTKSETEQVPNPLEKILVM